MASAVHTEIDSGNINPFDNELHRKKADLSNTTQMLPNQFFENWLWREGYLWNRVLPFYRDTRSTQRTTREDFVRDVLLPYLIIQVLRSDYSFVCWQAVSEVCQVTIDFAAEK